MKNAVVQTGGISGDNWPTGGEETDNARGPGHSKETIRFGRYETTFGEAASIGMELFSSFQ